MTLHRIIGRIIDLSKDWVLLVPKAFCFATEENDNTPINTTTYRFRSSSRYMVRRLDISCIMLLCITVDCSVIMSYVEGKNVDAIIPLGKPYL